MFKRSQQEASWLDRHNCCKTGGEIPNIQKSTYSQDYATYPNAYTHNQTVYITVI